MMVLVQLQVALDSCRSPPVSADEPRKSAPRFTNSRWGISLEAIVGIVGGT